MTLTKIDLLETISEDQQLMQLTFDGGKDTAFVIWNHADLLPHLGEEVIATFRKDIYKGKVEKFINTLAGIGVVRTLERDSNIKLYVDVTDNHSTILFRDIEEGTTVQDAIVYVVDTRYDSSARAEWVDLTIMDRARKIAQMRIFSPDNKTAELKGRYVRCDIRRNQYGLSTSHVVTVDSAFPYNPEVDICERYIMDTFAGDKDILQILSTTQFTSFAKQVIDPEPGYLLVRLAIELDLAAELGNLINSVDINLIKQCLLVEKFKVFQQASPYKEDIVTFITASRHNFAYKGKVLLTLYSNDPVYKNERALLGTVKEMADTVVRTKKGLL